MRTQFTLGIRLWIAVILAFSSSLAVAAPGKPDRLVAYVDGPEATEVYETSRAVALRFNLTNESDHDVKVLVWHTPLAGFSQDLFDVQRDGQTVAYIGPLVKRAAPTAADFVTIEAGATLSGSFDLSEGYDTSRPGRYTIRYRTEFLDDVVQPRPRPIEQLSVCVSPQEGGVEAWSLSIRIAGEDPGPRPEPQLGPMSQTPFYSGCNSSQRRDLNTALGNAEKMSIESQKYLAGLSITQQPDDPRYQEWFGAYDSVRYSTVSGHFVAIADAFVNETVSFLCDCTSSAYAYVYSNRPYEIHLCNAFWSAPALGTDSKAGTLIHEMSHFDVVADTNDYAYGQTACRKLAIKQPKKAIANADSHEYFAEAGLR